MQRDDRADGEVGVLQLRAGLIEHFAERQRRELQVRGEALELRRGKRGEEVVVVRTRREAHGLPRSSTPMPR